MAPSLTRRLSRLFGSDGRCLVVAMDHAGFMDKLLSGLERPEELVRSVSAAGADAFMLPVGSARRCEEAIGRAGLWLSVDAQPPLLERVAKLALTLDADGVKCMVYPGLGDEPNSMLRLAALVADCHAWGLPVMAEVIPGGFAAGSEMRTADKLGAGARAAVEAGADVIKTLYTGDPESFRAVVRYCLAPIVVLGGERATNDYQVLQGVCGALEAGASGVAIGRNIWQHSRPERMTAALAALVHSGASVDDAARMLE